ncbi:MAG: hypothetical protein R3C15_05130 [Thermoleophilia bacterium]
MCCAYCGRAFLTGERFRWWVVPTVSGEQPVCALCERSALRDGWSRSEREAARGAVVEGVATVRQVA